MAFPFEGSSLLDRGPAAGVAEPTWNTWTMVATLSIMGTGDEFTNIIIDNNGVAWMDGIIGSNNVHEFDRNGVHTIFVNMMHSTPWDTDGWSDYFKHHSLLYRYVITCDTIGLLTFNVIRDYAVIFTRNILLDVAGQTRISYVAMSPNGRYIGIVGHEALGLLDTRIIIYEGS